MIRLRRLLTGGLLAAFSFAAAAIVEVKPGPWELYKGTTKVSVHETQAECITAAEARGVATYSCRTKAGVVVLAPNQCGPDIGGWTVPVPTALDPAIPARGITQPGSRLHYISSVRGDDATGELYFWDGARIVNAAGSPADAAGVAYGTDPMYPSAAIKAFRSWGHTGPGSSATGDIGTRRQVGGSRSQFRAGFSDWWMFARGEVFDVGADLLAFERRFNPAATTAQGTLAVNGGRSATERQVVGAYGDLCLPRPRFVHPSAGFVSHLNVAGAPTLKHVAYLSLHFDGHGQLPGGNYSGLTLLYHTAASVDITFEDVWFDAAPVNISQKSGAHVTLRRVLITDVFSPDGRTHMQGLFYEGTREGVLRIEQSILLRNGFRGDPRAMAWPPSGQQAWNVFNRNLYVSGEANSMRSGIFDSVSMLGTSGDQIRPGMRIERNFFYQGYVTMGAFGGYPDADGPTGTIVDNVLQRFVGTGTTDNRGQPGWGFALTSGAYAVEVARNVVTGAQHAVNAPALELSPLGWPCYSHVFRQPTRANRVHRNVFESGTAPAVRITAGISGESPAGCAGMTGPGVVGNQIFDNITIGAGEGQFVTLGAALADSAANAAVYERNRVFQTRAAAAAALGWTAPDRTLRTYLLAKKVPVASVDGFPEYFQLATQQQRGKWRPEWTAKPIVNHIRTGVAMPALK